MLKHNYKTIRKNRTAINNMKSLTHCITRVNGPTNMKQIDEGKNAQIFMIQNKSCGTIVIKINFNKKTTKKEVDVLMLTNALIETNICPGYNYAHAFDIKNNRIYLEYADTNIRHYLLNSSISVHLFYSMLFQSLYSIMCFFYIAKRGHCDLHCSNIFIKNISENICFVYKLNGNEYYIPTYGQLYLMGDFGSAYICNRYNYDFHDFITSLQRLILRKTFNFITLRELHTVIPKKLLDTRNVKINITGNDRDDVRNINKVLVANIDLFDYTKWLPEHDCILIDILLKIKKHKNIISAIINIGSYFNKITTGQIYHLREINL